MRKQPDYCLVRYEDGSSGVMNIELGQTLPDIGEVMPSEAAELLRIFITGEEPTDIVELVDAIDVPEAPGPKSWTRKLDIFADFCVSAGEARILRLAKAQGVEIKL